MMKRQIYKVGLLFLFVFLIQCAERKDYKAIELNYENNETVTYDKAISLYQQLDNQFKTAKLLTYGMTDIGKPLHLFVMSKDRDFNPESIRKKNKRIFLINNGIHPGEPCGIDASIKFADEVLRNENNLGQILENTVICIIPVFNIGGSLNRSPYNRANDFFVKEAGFRGSAKNHDLNRDFSKADSRNTLAFYEIFRTWNPDMFIDAHETNGSDHQYALTLLHPQPDCLHRSLSEIYIEKMQPFLFEEMKKTGYELTPYVKMIGEDPKEGLWSWAASPRFTNGYTILFNTISIVTENHVYKSYKDRVLSIYHFIKNCAIYTNENSVLIKDARNKAIEETKKQTEFVVSWELDTTKVARILFKGYERKMMDSKISDTQHFSYDKNEPYEDSILFYDYYKPLVIVKKPQYYIIPQAWQDVITRLQINEVKMDRLAVDTVLLVNSYYITSYSTNEKLYSGHYFHDTVEVKDSLQQVKFYKGDYVIEMNQESNRYVIEMLEPKALDSFFKWNFFDICLEQRENYSPFAFEERALKLLKDKPDLKNIFEKKKMEDLKFRNDYYAQIEFLYKNSPYAEEEFMRYPVARIDKQLGLPLQ